MYASHIAAAVRLAFLITGDREQARDIAQDAFVKVAARFAELRDPGAFPSYLRTAVVNRSRDHLRRLQTHRRFLARQPRREGTAPPPDVEGRDTLWQSLQTLPVRQRTALVLRYYEDLSERQIAHELGTTESAVKSLLNRGLNQLRDEIRGESWNA
jgi:RNA polymerase sigma-70 factor (sigma-E family)